jgi:hypothetical protein
MVVFLSSHGWISPGFGGVSVHRGDIQKWLVLVYAVIPGTVRKIGVRRERM